MNIYTTEMGKCLKHGLWIFVWLVLFCFPIEPVVIFMRMPLGLGHFLATRRTRHVVPDCFPGYWRTLEDGADRDQISQQKAWLKPEVNQSYSSTWPQKHESLLLPFTESNCITDVWDGLGECILVFFHLQYCFSEYLWDDLGRKGEVEVSG